MNTGRLLRSRFVILAWAAWCLCAPSPHFAGRASAQTGPAAPAPVNPPLSADVVIHALIARNAQRAAAMASYTGTRTYRLEYKGFPSDRTAEMTVQVEFKAPYAKQFTVVTESGPKFFVNHVLKRLIESEQEFSNAENQRQTALNTENYDMALARYEPSPEGGQYVLKLTPKTDNKFLYRGEIWVDGREFAVTRIAAEPNKNPSFWITKTNITHRYENVAGFWVPMDDRTVSRTRSGTAVLTIQYRDYKITRSDPAASLLREAAVR